MKAIQSRLLDLLGANLIQFIIPVYQRLYSWDAKQCKDLWDDTMRAGQKNELHFVGSFLYTPESASTATSLKRNLLIDGQQRMTTISLMLAAFLDYIDEDEGRASFLTDVKPKSLRKNYLFNDDDYMGESRFKLILTQDDKATLQALVSKAPLPENPSKSLVDNYRYFSDKIHAKNFDPVAFWRGVGNLLIIDTELSPITDNAQLIFESMNSKGKPLTPIDLIRNYILMSLPCDEQMKLYEGYWRPIEQLFGRGSDSEFNAFIWYWLWLKVPGRKPREDEAYAEFKAYCQDEGLENDPEGLLRELREYARRYAAMFLDEEKDKDLAEGFRRIAGLGIKPIRPLMLALYTLYERESAALDKAAFMRLCTYIESFLFRRSVVGRFTTGLNNFFAGMYLELEVSEEPEQYVTAMLLIHDKTMTAYFPTDEDFASALTTRDLYHHFSKCRYYLERIENWYSPKEPIPRDVYQVEHVLPQKIDASTGWQEALGENWQETHERLVNTLGNLTLTGYNQEYSNRPFSEKLNLANEGFKFSHLRLNSYIAQQVKWDAETIEARASLLAKDALKIWPYPKLAAETVELYRPKKNSDCDSEWDIERDHPAFMPGGKCYELFSQLCSAIEEHHPDWEQLTKKCYVGYYTTYGRKLHISIHERVSTGSVAIGLDKSVDDLEDPQGLAQDKREVKNFGPGMPTRVDLQSAADLDAVLALIMQC